MELFGKIKAILPTRTGTRADGSTWTTTSFEIEEVSGVYPQSIILDTFEADPAKIGIKVGAVGTVVFSTRIGTSRDGRRFNQIRFNGFRPYENQTGAAVTSTEAHTAQQQELNMMAAAHAAAQAPAQPHQQGENPEGVDDLPF